MFFFGMSRSRPDLYNVALSYLGHARWPTLVVAPRSEYVCYHTPKWPDRLLWKTLRNKGSNVTPATKHGSSTKLVQLRACRCGMNLLHVFRVSKARTEKKHSDPYRYRYDHTGTWSRGWEKWGAPSRVCTTARKPSPNTTYGTKYT